MYTTYRHCTDSKVEMISDYDVCAAGGFIAPATYIRYARLCLLISISVKSPVIVIRLLDAMICKPMPRGWLDTCTDDLKWLNLSGINYGDNIFSFMSTAKDNPKKVKRELIQFSKSKLYKLVFK